ncbi:MAG: hypothetical protein ACOC16_00015 [Nanoarchaeota archaeon]
MGQFDSIINLFNDTGEGIYKIVGNEQTLYATYFIAFFAIVYKLLHIGLNRGNFQGKPANVISIMLSVIITGSVFYSKSPTELITLFGDTLGMILGIIIAGLIVFFSISMYIKNKKLNPNGMFLLLTFGIYIASSILIPHMGLLANKITSLKFLETIIVNVNLVFLILSLFAIVKFVAHLPSSKKMGGLIGNRAKNEYNETSTLKKHMNTLNQQLTEADTIVNNLNRLIQMENGKN